MELNVDFTKRVVVHGDTLEWRESPVPGVRRRMFDRIGDEVARATSMVSYAPNSRFSPHVHHGGEEFIVLDGVFEDEHGAYPKDTYIRNPPLSRHTPGSTPGCVMLVKLWQFETTDRTEVRLHTDKIESIPDNQRPGVTVTPLFCDPHETVQIEHWSAGAHTTIDASGGAELFVIGGGFTEGDDRFRLHSWLRLPIGSQPRLAAGASGARVWIKTGHLRYVRRPEL